MSFNRPALKSAGAHFFASGFNRLKISTSFEYAAWMRADEYSDSSSPSSSPHAGPIERGSAPAHINKLTEFHDVSRQLFRQTVEGTFKLDVEKKLRQLGVRT
jgi:hypothetical protein